jgi:hypothetical protein
MVSKFVKLNKQIMTIRYKKLKKTKTHTKIIKITNLTPLSLKSTGGLIKKEGVTRAAS